MNRLNDFLASKDFIYLSEFIENAVGTDHRLYLTLLIITESPK